MNSHYPSSQWRLIFTSCVFAMILSGCADKPTAPPSVHELGPQGSFLLRQVSAVSSVQDVLPGGSLYEIRMPDTWNGDFVVYAHGYVRPQEPIALPDDAIDGMPVHEIANQLGYAYASLSYRRNGLVIVDAVTDLTELVDVIRQDHPATHHIFVAGVSEGALISTLAAERHPDLIDGVVAACGPLGNFRRQLNYFGDFRLVFDYFFPIIPGSPVAIPEDVIQQWETVYKPQVLAALAMYPDRTRQLLAVTGAPIDPNDLTSVGRTVIGLLEYNIYGTNDATSQLGGQPIDNHLRWYRGSDNDWRLNRRIERVRADAAALAAIAAGYETSGRLRTPLAGIHTTGDEIVPYFHAPLYRLKALLHGGALYHSNLPVVRYGHCEFTVPELLAAFAIVVFKATAVDLLVADHVLRESGDRVQLCSLADQGGAHPRVVTATPTR